MDVKLLKGNNLELLKTLEPNSVDAIITDPPYGLEFMNKKWDYDVPSVELWKEVYRVLKPGGHILSFGGTRTYHRMVVNIEDAGFEIRDCIQWIYGSGFPKSHNIGKAMDKLEGNEREDLGLDPNSIGRNMKREFINGSGIKRTRNQYLTKGNTQWEGWGSALKPANEPIVLARKPLDEKTIAENIKEWGTGGININGCRISTDENLIRTGDELGNRYANFNTSSGKGNCDIKTGSLDGRFPANVILECTCDEVIKGEIGEIINSGGSRDNCDITHEWGYKEIVRTTYTDKGDIHTNPDCPCYIMNEQSGVLKSGNGKSGLTKIKRNGNTNGVCKMDMGKSDDAIHYGDKGGASRFFYVAKVSKKERNLGIEKNNHPTIKPINLLTYLIRLITPPNGVVLDMYMGSGSTGIAALLEDKHFIGMEMEDEYFNIAEARINNYEQYRKLLK